MKNKRILIAVLAALMCMSACENRKNTDSAQTTSSASQTDVSESDSSIAAQPETTAATTTVTTTATTTETTTTTTALAVSQPDQTGSSEAADTSSKQKITVVSAKTKLTDRVGEIGIGNYKIKTHDIAEHPQWQYNYSYTATIWDMDVSAAMTFDNYSCEIVPIEKPGKVDHEQTIEYNGRTVRCHTEKSKTLDGTPLFDSMTLYLYTSGRYNIRLDITPGGKYKSANYRFVRDGDFSHWLVKNKSEFSGISSDPKDYLYIFDSLEL